MFNYFNLSMHSAIWIDCNFHGKEDRVELTLELCANSFNALPEKALRHEDLQGAPLLILANKQVRSAVVSFHLKKCLKILIQIPNKVVAIFSILHLHIVEVKQQQYWLSWKLKILCMAFSGWISYTHWLLLSWNCLF